MEKKNFDSSQNTPYICQITFRTRTSKIQKKNLSYYDFFNFFFQNIITFGETIPKRYNTWGHGVVLHILGGWGGVGHWVGVAGVGFLNW